MISWVTPFIIISVLFFLAIKVLQKSQLRRKNENFYKSFTYNIDNLFLTET